LTPYGQATVAAADRGERFLHEHDCNPLLAMSCDNLL
jgi:hypothetical protein